MEKRKTPSIFGREIKQALALEQPSLKSEDLPEFGRFYVDSGVLDQLYNNSNELIVGRRGTGKTHLLGAFDEMIRDDHPDEISVLTSLMNIHRDSPVPNDVSANEYKKLHATDLFEEFLLRFFPLFLTKADRRLNTIALTLDKRSAKKKRDKVNNLLTQLLEVLELGSPVRTSGSERKVIETKEKSSNGKGAKLAIGLENSKPVFSANASIEKGHSGGDETSRTIEIHSKYKVDIIKARDLVHELLEELDVPVLYILIDEWMELDKRTPSGIQPMFAQLLKKTFFNTNKIAIKIASVWHQTTLYDKDDMERSQGVELKHDIMRTVDLDTTFFTSEDAVRDFCKELLFKRIEYVFEKSEIRSSRSISQLRKEDDVIDDVFVKELFDEEVNFRAFIVSSHGIPRDLMNIFHLCSLKIKRNFQMHCVSHELVHEVARATYNTDKRKTIEPNSDAQKLLRIINSYMESSGRRMFLVRNDQMTKSRALRKLVDEEVVHQVPSAVTPRQICDTHKTFMIDMGNYVDWIATRQSDMSALLSESVLAVFPEDFGDNIESYEIDVSAVETDTVKCPSCDATFSMSEPVYEKAGLCIKCAVELPPRQPEEASANLRG